MHSNALYFTVATAGHVDHGKTSVLRSLTGTDPDRLKEEKLRQMTTDLGFAHLALPPVESAGGVAGVRAGEEQPELLVGFIDVPGHGKFLKNMLAGVGGIHMALLVVAADEGPMPQTISHVKILSLLGVTHALLVLTKIDLAGEQRAGEVALKSSSMLKEYGIECLDTAVVSNTQNTGFDDLKAKLGAALISLKRLPPSELSMLPIDRVFTKAGYGVVITGTLVHGSLSVGDSIAIEPGGIKGRVRGLETFKKQLESASAGQRLAVNVALKEQKPLARGQVISTAPLPVVQTVIANLQQVGPQLEWTKEKELADQDIRLYHGTAECAGHLRWCEAIYEEDQQRKLVAQISLQDAAVAEPGDRFVLRYGDEGITGGIVLMNSRPRWLTRHKLNAFAKFLIAEDFVAAAIFYIKNAAQLATALPLLETYIPRTGRVSALAELRKSSELFEVANFFVDKARADIMKNEIVEVIGKNTQSSEFVSSESLRVQLARGLDRSIFQQLIKDLVDRAVVLKDGDKLSLKSDEAQKSKESLSPLAAKVETLLQGELCLEIQEIGKRLGLDEKSVAAALAVLSQQKKAEVINYEFAASADAIKNAHKALAKIWGQKKEISPADFRDELATTRKYALAFLAYFDDKGVTRRVQNSRVLLKSPT